jgi:hypothetical protein
MIIIIDPIQEIFMPWTSPPSWGPGSGDRYVRDLATLLGLRLWGQVGQRPSPSPRA